MSIEMNKWEKAKLTRKKTHKQRLAQAMQEWKATMRENFTERDIAKKNATHPGSKAKIAKEAARKAGRIAKLFDTGFKI